MFEPNSIHCTTCQEIDPETNDDHETTCCNDTVCYVDKTGRCERCNPLCTLCGFDIIDGYYPGKKGPEHFDRQCPKGTEKKAKPARKITPATPAKIEAVREHQKRATTSHTHCDHPSTSSARARCRRERAAKA